jgi:hypothetical protein
MMRRRRQGAKISAVRGGGGEGAGEVLHDEDADGSAEAGAAEVGDVEPAADGAGVALVDEVGRHAAHGAGVELRGEHADEQRQCQGRGVAGDGSVHEQRACAQAQSCDGGEDQRPGAAFEAAVHQRGDKEAGVAGQQGCQLQKGDVVYGEAARGEQQLQRDDDEPAVEAEGEIGDADQPGWSAPLHGVECIGRRRRAGVGR